MPNTNWVLFGISIIYILLPHDYINKALFEIKTVDEVKEYDEAELEFD